MDRKEPDPGTNGATPEKSGAIGKIWRGEHPLWFSFWVLSIGAGLAIMLFWSNLGQAVSRPGTWPHGLAAWLGQGVWLLIAAPLFGACCLYLLIALVGAWRSAGRYQGWKIWRWLAWIVLAAAMLGLANLLFALLA